MIFSVPSCYCCFVDADFTFLVIDVWMNGLRVHCCDKKDSIFFFLTIFSVSPNEFNHIWFTNEELE